MPADVPAVLSPEELGRLAEGRPRWSRHETHCVFCLRPFPTRADLDRHAGVECDPDPCWCITLCWVEYGGDCLGPPDGLTEELDLWCHVRSIEERHDALLASAIHYAQEAEREQREHRYMAKALNDLLHAGAGVVVPDVPTEMVSYSESLRLTLQHHYAVVAERDAAVARAAATEALAVETSVTFIELAQSLQARAEAAESLLDRVRAVHRRYELALAERRHAGNAAMDACDELGDLLTPTTETPEAAMSTIETTVCIRCELEMEPQHMDSRVCPQAADGGGCEPPHPTGRWLPSTTVRFGSSLHAAHCERSDPSVWLPPDMPCTCSIPTPTTEPEGNDGS